MPAGGFTAVNGSQWRGSGHHTRALRQHPVPRQRSGHPAQDPWLRVAEWIRAAGSEVLALVPAECGLLDACQTALRPVGTPQARTLTILCGLSVDAAAQQAALLAGGGAQVRFARHSPTMLLVLDRRVAVLAGGASDGAALTVMRAEPAIEALVSLFAHHWRQAQAEAVPATRPRLSELQTRVLQRLATGVTDEVVARELDISTRTVQRQVTQIMNMIGVRSRLELGLRLAGLGLTAPAAAPVCAGQSG